MYRTPLTVLEASASNYASSAVFKLPGTVDSDTGRVQEWTSITYAQFKDDVELHARYWSRTLAGDNIPPRSVVALWYVCSNTAVLSKSLTSFFRLGGMTYLNVLCIYGILRAGYIPQLFSLYYIRMKSWL